MQSMTGYGRGQCTIGQKTVTIELKSVNSRYLELNIRMPRVFNPLESTLRSIIASRIKRGHVDVYISYINLGASEGTMLDQGLVRSYLALAEQLASMGIPNDLTASKVLEFKDVLVDKPDAEDMGPLKELLTSALSIALDGLIAMRAEEGANLTEDILSRLSTIEGYAAQVATFAPEVLEAYRTKLQARMRAILGEIPVDEARLLNEVAFYADKIDINEELTRLASHIQCFRTYLKDGSDGQSPNHWAQEMLREANTMGSKANSARLTQVVVGIKNEIEKVREQVQNLE